MRHVKKTVALFLLIFVSQGYASEQLDCQQMESDILMLIEQIESRSITLSEIPSWYLGIPGLLRFAGTFEPIVDEIDKVLGQEFRRDLAARTPQTVIDAALLLAYPLVTFSYMPADAVRIPYCALTKNMMQRRLDKLKDRYSRECESL